MNKVDKVIALTLDVVQMYIRHRSTHQIVADVYCVDVATVNAACYDRNWDSPLYRTHSKLYCDGLLGMHRELTHTYQNNLCMAIREVWDEVTKGSVVDSPVFNTVEEE